MAFPRTTAARTDKVAGAAPATAAPEQNAAGHGEAARQVNSNPSLAASGAVATGEADVRGTVAKEPAHYSRGRSTAARSSTRQTRMSSHHLTSPPRRGLASLLFRVDRHRHSDEARTKDGAANAEEILTGGHNKVDTGNSTALPAEAANQGITPATNSNTEDHSEDHSLFLQRQQQHLLQHHQRRSLQLKQRSLQSKPQQHPFQQQQHELHQPLPDAGSVMQRVQQRQGWADQQVLVKEGICLHEDERLAAGKSTACARETLGHPKQGHEPHTDEVQHTADHRSTTSTNISRYSSSGSEAVRNDCSSQPSSPVACGGSVSTVSSGGSRRSGVNSSSSGSFCTDVSKRCSTDSSCSGLESHLQAEYSGGGAGEVERTCKAGRHSEVSRECKSTYDRGSADDKGSSKEDVQFAQRTSARKVSAATSTLRRVYSLLHDVGDRGKKEEPFPSELTTTFVTNIAPGAAPPPQLSLSGVSPTYHRGTPIHPPIESSFHAPTKAAEAASHVIPDLSRAAAVELRVVDDGAPMPLMLPPVTAAALPSPPSCATAATSPDASAAAASALYVSASPITSAATCPADAAASPAASLAGPLTASAAAPAAAAGGEKRAGGRLSGMLMRARSGLKVGSTGKESTRALKEHGRRRTVPGAVAGNSFRAETTCSSSNPPASHSSLPSLSALSNMLASPLVLRQMRRREARELRRTSAGKDASFPIGERASSAEHREERLIEQYATPSAATVAAAGALVAEKAVERETARTGGVLRGGRGDTAEEPENERQDEFERSPEELGWKESKPTLDRRRRGNHRLSTSGTSGTSLEGGEQVKSVRFGSMSVHVYAREARIRSCSSDSLNFAVALDPPVSAADWPHTHDFARRTLLDADDDESDYEGAARAEEVNETEVDDEDEEEDGEGAEEHRGLSAHFSAGAAAARSAVPREDHHLSWRRPAVGACHEGDAVVEKSQKTGAADTVCTAEHPLQHEAAWRLAYDRHLEDRLSQKHSGARHEHSVLPAARDGSDGIADNFVEGYPSQFEELYGKPHGMSSSHESWKKIAGGSDEPLASYSLPQQPTMPILRAQRGRGSPPFSPVSTNAKRATVDVTGKSELVDLQERPGEYPTAPGAAGPEQSRRIVAASLPRTIGSTGGEVHRSAALQGSPEAPADAPAVSTNVGSDTLARFETDSAPWWRRLLTSSSSELDEPCSHGERRSGVFQEEERSTHKKGDSFFVEPPLHIAKVKHIGQEIAAVPVEAITAAATASLSSATAPAAGALISGTGVTGAAPTHFSVAGSWERLVTSAELIEEPATSAQEKGCGRGEGGSCSSVQRVESTEAAFGRQPGQTQPRMQQRAPKKGRLAFTEKGMEGTQVHESLPCKKHTSREVNAESCGTLSAPLPPSASIQGHLKHILTERAQQGAQSDDRLQRNQSKLNSLLVQGKREVVPSYDGEGEEYARFSDRSNEKAGLGLLLLKRDDHGSVGEGQQQPQHRLHRNKSGDMLLGELPLLKDSVTDPQRLYSSVSSSTTASSDTCRTRDSFSTVQDLPTRLLNSGSLNYELPGQQDPGYKAESQFTIVPCPRGSAPSANYSELSHLPCTTSYEQICLVDQTMQQPKHELVQLRSQPQTLLQSHHHSFEEEDSTQQPMHVILQHSQIDSLIRRELRGSSSSVETCTRHPHEAEALSKAAEEAIARSSSAMSAEEKETLKDIVKGWCS